MDRERIVEPLPHYVAMLVLVFLVLAVVRAVAGDIGFRVELAIVAVIVLTY